MQLGRIDEALEVFRETVRRHPGNSAIFGSLGDCCAAAGKTIRFEEQPIEPIRAQNGDLASILEWFSQVGYGADVKALREVYPDIGWQTFAEWASEYDWSAVFAEPERAAA